MAASLSSICNLYITLENSRITQAGFGTPLILADASSAVRTAYGADKVRTYTEAADMLDDGWLSTDAGYRIAAACLSQTPAPSSVKVGLRLVNLTRVIHLTPTTYVTGEVYSGTIAGADWTYTVLAEDTSISAVVDKLITAINTAVSGTPCTDGTTHVIYTCAAGTFDDFVDLTDNLVFSDETVDPVDRSKIISLTPTSTTEGAVYSGTIDGHAWTYTLLAADDTIPEVVAKLVSTINTAVGGTPCAAVGTPVTHLVYTGTAGVDVPFAGLSSNITVADLSVYPLSGKTSTSLAAISAQDDDWYGLLTDGYSKALHVATATHIEAVRKLYKGQTSDTAVITSGSSDVASTLKAASRARTGLDFSLDYTCEAHSAGLMGQRLTSVPGSDTWHQKNVSGAIPSDRLTASQKVQLELKKCNRYETLGGTGRTFGGWQCIGEYTDVIRFVDWLYARIQETVVAGLAALEKLPFTANGLAVIEGYIKSVLSAGVAAGGLTNDPEPTVTMPALANISAADKAARKLSGITFAATLAGAIHYVDAIRGKIGV